MKNFFHWLLTSSIDPSKLALTVKGGLGVVITVVVALSPLFHLSIGSDQLNAIADALVQIVTIAAMLVSAIAGVVGLVRKIKTNPPVPPTPLVLPPPVSPSVAPSGLS